VVLYLEDDDNILVYAADEYEGSGRISHFRIIRKSKDQKIRSLPVIALTASLIMEVQEKIQEVGMNDYILKPFNPNELFQKILGQLL